MIRCFVAIPLPEDILAELDRVSRQLRDLGIDARFPRPESIHLTLKFLGDVPESVIPDILTTLEARVSRHEPFEVNVRKAGVFPHLANPRVVWLGIEPEDELRQLQLSVEKGLVELGFEKERRRFSPHLTLARVKSRRMIANLMHYVEVHGPSLELGSFAVGTVILYRSELRPDGAVYSQLGSAALR